MAVHSDVHTSGVTVPGPAQTQFVSVGCTSTREAEKPAFVHASVQALSTFGELDPLEVEEPPDEVELLVDDLESEPSEQPPAARKRPIEPNTSALVVAEVMCPPRSHTRSANANWNGRPVGASVERGRA